jgi:hypothetical protein
MGDAVPGTRGMRLTACDLARATRPFAATVRRRRNVEVAATRASERNPAPGPGKVASIAGQPCVRVIHRCVSPAGTLMPGKPTRLVGMVNRSFRYMANPGECPFRIPAYAIRAYHPREGPSASGSNAPGRRRERWAPGLLLPAWAGSLVTGAAVPAAGPFPAAVSFPPPLACPPALSQS